MSIFIENIHKSYDGLKVLKGITMHISEGEVVAIVGPSGAGKSTLLHIMGTIDRPDSGTVQLMKTDVLKMSEKRLADFRNKNIGFVFQFHHLLPEFTALENTIIPALIHGEKESTAIENAKVWFEYLNLSHRITHKPSELSGGEQQRVAVARALINNPPLLLADEPSGNLDSSNAGELHQLFFDLRKKFNKTIVIVTHNNELAQMADRKVVIRDGQIDN